MNAGDATLLTLLPILLVGSAFFSGSETALFGLSEHERAQLERRWALSGRAAAALLAHPRMLLITILLGNMVVNVLFFVIASVLSLRAETALMQAAYSVGPLLALILLGEVTPKLLATGQRIRWCGLFSPPMLALHRLIGPVRIVLNALVVEPAARLFHTRAETTLSPEELGELLSLSAGEGSIDPAEAELLDDVIELSALRVRDIMTPRVDIRAVRADASGADIEAAARESHIARLPVCENSLDDGVIGMLDIRVYLAEAAARPSLSVRELMIDPLFVPESARLDQLLDLFRGRNRLTAIVLDEYGAVEGLVSFSDVARRMAAGLETSHTIGGESDHPGIEKLDGGRWRVPGRLSMHDLVQAFGPTPSRVAGAVAGLINAELGRIAQPGDVVHIGNVRLEVESMRGRAVDRVIVSVERGGGGGDA